MSEMRDYISNYWVGWGESAKAILQVNIADFSSAVEIFSGKDVTAPLEKLARTPMKVVIVYPG